MIKNIIIISILIVMAIGTAFLILKPSAKPASDGHTDHTHNTAKEHVPVQDESKPHGHDN